MKILYKLGEIYLVEIGDNCVYYGDGEYTNGFGVSAMQFLRFNPCMDYVGDICLNIPKKRYKIIGTPLLDNRKIIKTI